MLKVNRSQFILYTIANFSLFFVITVPVAYITKDLPAYCTPIYSTVYLISLIGFFVFQGKTIFGRLKDLGLPKTHIFWLFIPVINVFILLQLILTPGKIELFIYENETTDKKDYDKKYDLHIDLPEDVINQAYKTYENEVLIYRDENNVFIKELISILDCEGILTSIRNEFIDISRPIYSVYVQNDYFDIAKKIITKHKLAMEKMKLKTIFEGVKCTKCRSNEFYEEKYRTFISTILHPYKKKYYCGKCGKEIWLKL